MLDETHDPGRRSWVPSAQATDTDFPIQNLPLGAFKPSPSARVRIGVAIGEEVFDVAAALAAGLLDGATRPAAEACAGETLNPLMTMAPEASRGLRWRIFHLLADDARQAEREAASRCLVAQADVDLVLPVAVGDYTDFYASIHHATNVGRMMRPDNPLLPNYRWVPIGYHGRASSLVVSDTPVVRPRGQVKPESAEAPEHRASQRLDYELELGAYIGVGNAPGVPIDAADAHRHLFGLCLVNDWSARDIQAWEYQPLGPFLSKSFATSLSPWVVTAQALEPFRRAPAPRPEDAPAPLAYLDAPYERERGALDVELEVWLTSAQMRAANQPPVCVTRSHARHLYWTLGQLITHHASNGCHLRPGDLLASGTVSGPDPASRGCLLERTWRGTEPLVLPGGEQRRFLEDGDEVVIRGRAVRAGRATIGFGECRARIAPARDGA